MSANVVRTTDAQADLTRILTYFLDANEPLLAGRFLDAYEQTLKWIADSPELGAPWEYGDEAVKDVRVKPIIGFENHLVFYRIGPRGVYILHLFHGHQDIDNLL
jgi:plasmid stabilization system protein ParE